MSKLIKLFILALLISSNLMAANLSEPLKQKLGVDNLIGATELKYFGLKVYEINLWCEKPKFSYDQKFAIQIRYNMNFTKEELAKRSIEEIEKLHALNDSEKNDYYQKLLKIFSNVKKGDEKVAYFSPKKGVEMFYNNQLVGDISDLKLARQFVDIWLDERGSFPNVTKKLLGKND